MTVVIGMTRAGSCRTWSRTIRRIFVWGSSDSGSSSLRFPEADDFRKIGQYPQENERLKLTWGIAKAPFSCWGAGGGADGGHELVGGCCSFFDAANMDWIEALGSDKGGGVEDVFREGCGDGCLLET